MNSLDDRITILTIRKKRQMNKFERTVEVLNDRDAQNTFDFADVEKNRAAAIIPYFFPFLFWLPLVVDKKSSYCRFHANQQLLWFIASLIISLLTGILAFIPILGILADLVLYFAILAADIIFAYGAYKGKALVIPVIGKEFKIFK